MTYARMASYILRKNHCATYDIWPASRTAIAYSSYAPKKWGASYLYAMQSELHYWHILTTHGQKQSPPTKSNSTKATATCNVPATTTTYGRTPRITCVYYNTYMMHEYWQRQTPESPLFPDIAWQKPEQKAHAGKLLIIGGNAHSFAAVATAYQDALAAGAGECRVALPDALKKTIDPLAIDCLFVPTNAGGGITKDSLPQLKAATAWADTLLFIGDAGRNSETAIVYEQLLQAFPDTRTVVTRDALDLLHHNWPQLLAQPHCLLIATFAQLQKMFQAVYYPKTLLFSMQLTQVVEALHKFTLTYPAGVMVFHQNQLIMAKNGSISTTPWQEPLLIWRGSVAAKTAVFVMQNGNNMLESATASLV